MLLTLVLLGTLDIYSSQIWENIKIPEDVEKKIKAYADKKWPENYEMQLYTLKKQRIAFQKMTNLKALSTTNKIIMKIIKKSEEDWPQNYEMQVYQSKKQMKAYLELNK